MLRERSQTQKTKHHIISFYMANLATVKERRSGLLGLEDRFQKGLDETYSNGNVLNLDCGGIYAQVCTFVKTEHSKWVYCIAGKFFLNKIDFWKAAFTVISMSFLFFKFTQSCLYSHKHERSHL